jgi:hypothetical protein
VLKVAVSLLHCADDRILSEPVLGVCRLSFKTRLFGPCLL